jgi:hypothetical protein
MRTLDAALYLARRFQNGVEGAALLLPSTDPNKPAGSTKSASTLRHELTASGTAKLGLEDAELLTMRAIQMRVKDPLAILNAFAGNCGAMVLQLPDSYEGDDITIAGLAKMAQEAAEFMSSVASAAADNQVNENELARVDKELGELIACAQSLRTRLAALHEASKPRSSTAK